MTIKLESRGSRNDASAAKRKPAKKMVARAKKHAAPTTSSVYVLARVNIRNSKNA